MNRGPDSTTVPGQKAPPPIKDSPTAPDDGFDSDRIRLVRADRWEPQTAALIAFHRTVEDNIRMLAGRQWDVWSELLGSYVDVTQFMTDEEKRWRQRPVVNLLQYWFMLTHARLTESPPAVTFQPATSDRLDQQLADSLAPIFKTLWAETGMDETFVRATAWLIAAGEVYVESQVDFTKGDIRSLSAPAVLSMDGPDGQAIERQTQGPVPYDAQGNPQASLTQDGSGYDVNDGAQPHEDYEGGICPRVRSPLEVRSEWGADTAWEDRRWIITRSYMTPQEIFDKYGVATQSDADVAMDASTVFLQRLLFSSGYFGSVSNRPGSNITSPGFGDQHYVAVDTMWEKPSPFSPATDESPGGRLLVVTGSKVLHDSVRPFRTKAAGPIRRAQFIQQPGRGGFGSTPLEQMTPIQKTYNRGWAQILEHRNLCTNPILICDTDSGVAEQRTNAPGSTIEVDMSKPVGAQGPVYYLAPPPLSNDVWKVQAMLLDIIMRLGSIAGAEGSPQTDDPSGELVSQLRFNSDRPVAIAARSMAHLITGVADDWVAILPTIWTDQKTISYIGDDEVFRTITLTADLWDGDIRVRPDLENARLETPESKQQRALSLFTAGVFGPPGEPSATAGFAAYAKTAGLDTLVGADRGVDADMIRQLMSNLAQGMPVQEVTFEEWYDYGVWLKILREHLASPEYLKYDPPVKQSFKLFYALVQHAQQAVVLTEMQRQAPIAAQVAATQGQIASVAAAHGPQDPDTQQPSSDATPASGDKAA